MNDPGKPRLPRHLAALLGLTLMPQLIACAQELYGVAASDEDGDGFFAPHDCDDSDDSIHPEADDPEGDGVDQDCDGVDGTAADTDA